MLKILVNAYACSPHTGSEPGMGWNWCVHLAKHCELHIITEGEFKEHIEKALKVLPQADNMHFYYNPVPDKVRKMCWNQGDWRFYRYYKKWQYSTYTMAIEICQKQQIDILHQLNMIGFREPGYLWKITDTPFVWGPIGGLKQFPAAYLKEASVKIRLINRLKNIINIKQLRYDQRVHKALNRADLLISSIPDSYIAIKKYKGLESVIIPETGCFPSGNNSTKRFNNDYFELIWVAKFDFRKQLALALKSIAASKNNVVRLHVYGEGNQKQESEVKELALKLNIDKQIIWYGNQSNETVQKAMRKAQLFFFTSVSEDTSTVVLEAVSNNLPVLCFDTCGMGAVINDKVGRKVPLSNPENSIDNFAEQINILEGQRFLLEEMSFNCEQRKKELSWDKKAITMLGLYENCL